MKESILFIVSVGCLCWATIGLTKSYEPKGDYILDMKPDGVVVTDMETNQSTFVEYGKLEIYLIGDNL